MASKRVPVLESNPKAQRTLPAGEELPPKRWTFGFSFFKQIDYFGFENLDVKWFASLFEKLQILSLEYVDTFLGDPTKRESWRFHNIDWDSYNIPISLGDLNWLPTDVRSNQTEFPLQQFQISKALGRVVGYFDEEMVFQIVLLDPLHNLQPSKAHNYRVRTSVPLSCEYTYLREEILKATQQAQCQEEGSCPVKKILSGIDSKPDAAFNLVIMKPSDDIVKNGNDLLSSGKAKSYEEIFETGVVYLLELPS